MDNSTNSLIVSFLSEVAEMTPSFQEELQLSCFQLILETPESCLEALLPSLPPVISSLLQLSTSLLWLAEVTLTRLLGWLDLLGEEKMDPVLRAALPLLKPHLATNYASLIVEGKELTKATRKGQKQVKAGLKKLKVVSKVKVVLHDTQSGTLAGWRTRVWCSSFQIVVGSSCSCFFPSEKSPPSH